MRLRCRIGLHPWESVDYYHRPDWHDQREYGGTIIRCGNCHTPVGRRGARKVRWSGITIETGGHW